MPRRRRKPEIIIVSLIDIFAILLIFMVMTTQFKQEVPEQPEVTIKLPEAKSAVAAESTGRRIILSISDQEEIFLDAKKVAISDLAHSLEALIAASPNSSLALNADRKAPFGTIIKVLDVLKEAGVKGNLSAFTEMRK